jgi:hypothetical protein
MPTFKRNNAFIEPWYEMFQAASREVSEDGFPYEGLTKDFVQLTAMMKKEAVAEWMTEERWQRGLENYFCSEVGTPTLADFCVRFSTFYKAPRDRFNQPMDVPAPKRKVEDEDDDEGRKAIRRLAELRSEPPVDFAAEKKRWLAAQEVKRAEAERAAGEREGRDGQSG